MKNKRVHYWHMVDPSPWPILTALILFNTLVSLILYFHFKNISIFLALINFIFLVISVNNWFSDIIREATYEGKHTKLVQKGLKLGMILFIISEVMFFFSFFWGYLHFALSPAIEIGCIWPPYGIQVFNYLHVPLYNTFVLLLSGVCVTWTHNEIVLKNSKNKFNSYFSLILTILLAIHFTYWQLKEYIMSSFSIADSVYGSIFFMATGFHGFHVILGTLFLSVCYVRLWKFHFTRNHHLGLEFAIWYWHFVDVVWLFLYIVVYWWSSVSVGININIE